MYHKTHVLRPLALLVGLLTAACGEKGMTYGDANSVVAVTAPELWDEISDDVASALEQTVQTVRDEKQFTVTYQEPYAQFWENLRRFRQMLLIGTASDPWIQEALEETSTEIELQGPGLYQVDNVWSRDQTVTLIVLPDDRSTARLRELLPEVYRTLDRQFRDYARNRMYFSGVNTALADTLAAEAGFRLILPDVYRRTRADSVYVFRNDQPDPSELIRQITVTWRSPAPARLEAEDVLAWRQEVADAHYTEPQIVVEDGMSVSEDNFDGLTGLEIQTQWQNPPDRGWPAAGPVIVRALTCDGQDRTYLIDAWLYAPGREKYEYMIQLETILGTFECGV